MPPPPETASGPRAGDDGPEPRDAAYRALNDAYRLVDEYLRQGQKMAEDIWLPTAASGAEPSFGAPGRFLRAMSDMTLAWVEVMQDVTSAVSAPARKSPVGSAGAFNVGKERGRAPAEGAPAGVAATARASELTVRVQASGRVEVSVQVSELSDAAHLAPTELRSLAAEVEPIRDVSVVVVPDATPVLQIVVPDGQPKGTYNGLLLEAKSHKPRGTVSLTVL